MDYRKHLGTSKDFVAVGTLTTRLSHTLIHTKVGIH